MNKKFKTTQQAEAPTFEKVWASLQETDRILTEKFQETDKKFQETDRKFQETKAFLAEKSLESDRKFQETKELLAEESRETDRIFRKTDKKLNELENLFTGHWGKLMESLVEGDLIKLLRGKDIKVSITYSRIKFSYENRNGEIDLVALNGDEIVVVEVKTTLIPQDVQDFINNTLSNYKNIFPHHKSMKVYGAVAFLKAESRSDLRAERMELFVIKATGSSASIVNREDFKPKVF